MNTEIVAYCRGPDCALVFEADAESALAAVPGGSPFEVPGVLFAKIDDARRAELEARFAGAA